MFSLPIEWGKYSDRENYALIFNSLKENQKHLYLLKYHKIEE